ncbi:hypothetical protein C9374_003233 [Naegleria lovaniensis]|uniref:Uncharacterized protein n=1 Tax=Naegleria lovaniensis TaxID=51637 RepID=A0AA88KK23_NAELO|nr:uncharacterized protein C9374_003233 [Naegleria lovaniensis]KAG2385418.1 hypothetical protein C9374_003233 [Naegleria lovaniensis]
MSQYKTCFQYFFYKPQTWIVGTALLSVGSYINLKAQEGQQGKKFQDARPSAATLEFERVHLARPGENKDVCLQVDWAPSFHSSWLKRE